MLTIKDLHAGVEETQILKGLDLEMDIPPQLQMKTPIVLKHGVNVSHFL